MSTFKRIVIFGEGLTEQKFIEKVLAPHLARFSLAVQAPNLKGGKSYQRWKNDILKKCKEDPSAIVTTLIDYYGAPNDLPGRDLSKQSDPKLLYKTITDKLKNDIGPPNFIPNITIHEFEALLLSDYLKFDEVMGISGPKWVKEIEKNINEFETPEHINNSPQTAPSKRLQSIGTALKQPYDKTLHCSLLCDKIDLQVIRKKCHCFDTWLKTLESFGTPLSNS